MCICGHGSLFLPIKKKCVPSVLFFFFLAVYLLKKLEISLSLGFADCIRRTQFSMFLFPLYVLQMGSCIQRLHPLGRAIGDGVTFHWEAHI